MFVFKIIAAILVGTCLLLGAAFGLCLPLNLIM